MTIDLILKYASGLSPIIIAVMAIWFVRKSDFKDFELEQEKNFDEIKAELKDRVTNEILEAKVILQINELKINFKESVAMITKSLDDLKKTVEEYRNIELEVFKNFPINVKGEYTATKIK